MIYIFSLYSSFHLTSAAAFLISYRICRIWNVCLRLQERTKEREKKSMHKLFYFILYFFFCVWWGKWEMPHGMQMFLIRKHSVFLWIFYTVKIFRAVKIFSQVSCCDNIHELGISSECVVPTKSLRVDFIFFLKENLIIFNNVL